jgi:hypothetical protein
MYCYYLARLGGLSVLHPHRLRRNLQNDADLLHLSHRKSVKITQLLRVPCWHAECMAPIGREHMQNKRSATLAYYFKCRNSFG